MSGDKVIPLAQAVPVGAPTQILVATPILAPGQPALLPVATQPLPPPTSTYPRVVDGGYSAVQQALVPARSDPVAAEYHRKRERNIDPSITAGWTYGQIVNVPACCGCYLWSWMTSYCDGFCCCGHTAHRQNFERPVLQLAGFLFWLVLLVPLTIVALWLFLSEQKDWPMYESAKWGSAAIWVVAVCSIWLNPLWCCGFTTKYSDRHTGGNQTFVYLVVKPICSC